MLKQFVVGSAIALLSVATFAQEREGDKEFNYAVGLLVTTEQSLYPEGNDNVQFFPRLAAQWGSFFLRGPSIGVNLLDGEHWKASTSIALDFNGDNKRGDSPLLADMETLDNVVVGQFEIGYEDDWGEVALNLSADISGKHDGYTASIGYGYPLQAGRWRIEPGVEAQWFSAEVSQYYYGVTTADVRIDRPFYTADSGVNYEASITATYPFLKRHAIQFELSYKTFSTEISDSPIVDRDNIASIGVGYIYRF